MVVVRRTSPPDDDRLDKLRELTAGQLEANDWETIAVGAFFVGLHPEWGMADRLIALLKNAQWDVRRQAAESLGLLKHFVAAESLLAAFEKETDAHALGDELVALARLGRPEIKDLCKKMLLHNNFFVRQQAVCAARIFVFGEGNIALGIDSRPLDARIESFGLEIAELAARDSDLRVRREGIRLLSLLNSEKTFTGAIAAFAGNNTDELGQPCWAEALAANNAAFEEYIGQGMPGGDALLLAISANRRDSRLALELALRMDAMTANEADKYIAALICQKDNALARKALELRASLPQPFIDQLPLALDHVFPGRFGADLGAWAAAIAKSR